MDTIEARLARIKDAVRTLDERTREDVLGWFESEVAERVAEVARRKRTGSTSSTRTTPRPGR